MIKKDIVQYIYQRHGRHTLAEVEQYTEEFFDLLQKTMQEEDSLTITHFGRFRHKDRSVREVTMPSGQKVLTSSLERLQFLPSPVLKTYVNSDDVEHEE